MRPDFTNYTDFQLILHALPPTWNRFLGGGRGGAKSVAMAQAIWITAERYKEAAQVLYVRQGPWKSHRGFTRTLSTLFDHVYGPKNHALNGGTNIWSTPTGAHIELGILPDGDQGRKYYERNYQGNSFTHIFLDEAQQYARPENIDLLFSNLRSPDTPTAATIAANPGGLGHCIPFGDVLTPRGWVPIQRLSVGDPVYGVDSSGELVPSCVEQTHRATAAAVVEVNVRGLSMALTPDHRVAKVKGTRSARGRNFSLVRWSDLPGQATVLRSVSWSGTPIADVVLDRKRMSRLQQPMRLSGVQYARLLGWYLTEGYSTRGKRFEISQSKPLPRERLRKFIEEDCGFLGAWSKTGVAIHSREWTGHLDAFGFGYSETKFVPEIIKNATPPELEAFLDAAIDGDGCRQNGRDGADFYSSSRQLADDVAEIAVKLGYIVLQTSRTRETPDRIRKERAEHRVSIKKTKSGGTELLTGRHVYNVDTRTARRSRIRTVDGGPVYCIGLKEHAFVVRQNGSSWVSGNSWLAQRYINTGDKPWSLFDLTTRVDLGGDVIETSRPWISCPSTYLDNPHNGPDYLANLAASCNHDLDLLKAWITGSWDISRGAFFAASLDNPYIKIRWPIPEDWGSWQNFGWRFWLAHDHGSAEPSATYVMGRSPGGDGPDGLYYPRESCLILDEYVTHRPGDMSKGMGWNIDKTSEGIKALAERWRIPVRGVADSACFGKMGHTDSHGESKTIADEYREHGVLWHPAKKGRRRARFLRIKGLFANCGNIEKPGLYVSSRCAYWWGTVPFLVHDPKDPEVVLKCGTDHGLDASSYGLDGDSERSGFMQGPG